MDLGKLGITGDDIRTLRDDLEIGMETAKNILTKRALMKRCDEAQSIDDLKQIIQFLINRAY